MKVDTALQAVAHQQGAAVTGDGGLRDLRSTRAGQLFTVDWKANLVMAGHAYNITIGTVGGAAGITLIVGGGNATTIVGQEPEMAVGTPAGYFHIPLSFKCAVQGDSNANANVANIYLMADLTKIIPVPIAASATVEVAQNLLDGGPASVSRTQSATTTAISAPVGTMILDFATCQHSQISAAGAVIQTLKIDYDPSFPSFFKGPCSVVACWGGTVAQSGMASYCWAEVPVGYLE